LGRGGLQELAVELPEPRRGMEPAGRTPVVQKFGPSSSAGAGKCGRVADNYYWRAGPATGGRALYSCVALPTLWVGGAWSLGADDG